jgi:F-type H+-transporting ATPase subunit gamma
VATERELLKRIKSIKNISQVTSALAAVSAAKANKAQRQVEATRSYAGKAFEILNNLASQPGVGKNGHPLLSARQEIKCIALILITGNRGLAGAFNSAMVSFTEHFLSAWDVPVKIVAIGRKGRDLMIRRGYDVIASFDEIPDSPSILDVTSISQLVTDDFLNGKVDQVFVGYTDFINLISRRPSIKQLLPLKPTDFSDMAVAEYISNVDLSGVSEKVYDYEPGPEELLDVVVPRFTDLQVYQSILESQASEHSARYVAMNNATDNAAELVEILTLERNKARQSSITSEILDIVGGAEALAQI